MLLRYPTSNRPIIDHIWESAFTFLITLCRFCDFWLSARLPNLKAMPIIPLPLQRRLKLLLRPPKQSRGVLCQSAQFLVQAPRSLKSPEFTPDFIRRLLVCPNAHHDLLRVAAEP